MAKELDGCAVRWKRGKRRDPIQSDTFLCSTFGDGDTTALHWLLFWESFGKAMSRAVSIELEAESFHVSMSHESFPRKLMRKLSPLTDVELQAVGSSYADGRVECVS